VSRQCAAAGAALGGSLPAQRRILPLGLGVVLGNRRFDVLQAELQLLVRQPLRLPPELEPPQL